MIENQAKFLDIMRTWAGYLEAWYRKGQTFDRALEAAYYDGEHAAYLLGNSSLAELSFDAYVRKYVLPNQGKVQGYRNFTAGQLQDIRANTSRKAEATQSIQLQLKNGAFVASGDVSHVDYSRECSYAISTHVNAQRAGIALTQAQIDRLQYLVGCAVNHCKLWATGGTGIPYYRPFMGGLTVKALAEHADINGGPDITATLVQLANRTWTACWKEAKGTWGDGQSFLYTDRDAGSSMDAKTWPDLNQLIAPMFANVFKLTNDTSYRDKALKAFNGGIPIYDTNNTHQLGGAWVGDGPLSPSGKQINQQMFWVDKLFEWCDVAQPQPILSEKEFLKTQVDMIQKRLAILP